MAEYKITVDFKGSGGGSKKEKGYQSVFSEWADNIKEGINDINGGDSKFNHFVQGVQAFANVIPAAQIIKSGFDWQVSLIGRYKGSQQAQDIANASMKIAGQVGGIALAFATGNYVAGGLMTICIYPKIDFHRAIARHKIFRTKHSILQKARKNTVQCTTF